MIVLLVLSSAAAALVPVGTGPGTTSTSTTTSTERPPAGRLLKRTLNTGAPKPQTIKLSVGDQLQLRVISHTADQVEIRRLGEIADVDRDSPATFDLLATDQGTYPVRLVEAREDVGYLVVRGRRGAAQDGGRPTDSPGDSTAAVTPGALAAS